MARKAKNPVFSNDDTIEHLEACLTDFENTWKEFRKTQVECYERYRSERDHSNKKSWQHKMVIPSVYPAIKGASGLLKRILMKTDPFFEFVPERRDDASKIIDPNTGKPVEDQMDNFARAFSRKIKFHVDECGFIDKFGNACESALAVMEGVLRFNPKRKIESRVIWGQKPPEPGTATKQPFEFLREDTEKAVLDCEVVNPMFLFYPLDRSCVIEESRVPLHQLIDNPDQIPFDQKELNRMIAEDYSTGGEGAPPETEAEKTRRDMIKLFELRSNSFRKNVLLHTFWGTVTNKEGKVVVKAGRYIVANRRYVLLKPSPSPFWLREHPYVFISPLDVLFRVVGTGMVEGIRHVINALDNLANIAGDKMLYSLLPPTEVDIGKLEDAESVQGGLIPGKTYKVKNTQGTPAFRQVAVSDLPAGAVSFLEFLKDAVRNHTGWTEYMAGMPAGGDPTATEFKGSLETSTMTFESLAANLERTGIIESLEIIRDLTVQYFMRSDLNPETFDIFAQEKIYLDRLPESERWAFLNKRYPIKVKGLTAFFDKEKKTRNLIFLLEVISKIPLFQQRVDPDEFLKRLFTGSDQDNPEMLLLTTPYMPMGALPPGAPGAVPPGAGAPMPGNGGGMPEGVTPEMLMELFKRFQGSGGVIPDVSKTPTGRGPTLPAAIQ